MHDVIARTYLLAGRIEPRPCSRPPHRRRRRTQATLGRLLVGVGGILQRVGRRLSVSAPGTATIAPQPL